MRIEQTEKADGEVMELPFHDRLTVWQIGPIGKGGISAVIDSILSSDLNNSFYLQRVVTTRGKFDIFSIISATLSILTSRKKDAVAHVHMSSYGSFLRKEWMVRVCDACGIPVILHLHSGAFSKFYHTASPRLQKRIRNCLRLAGKIVVLTEDWVPFMRELGFEDKCVVACNFVPIPSVCHTFTEKPGIQVLFMGRIGESKGAFDLLRAFAALVKEPGGEACRLVLAGDGELQKAKNLCTELGISDFVSIPGWVSGGEREKLFLESDVLALPSYFESFGLSLVEGMSYGLPVVGGNASSIPYVVRNQEDGILVPPGDVTQIKEAMRHLLDCPEERRRMGEHARKHAEEAYSEATFVEKMKRIYEQERRC